MRITVPQGSRLDLRDRAATVLHQRTDGTFGINAAIIGADYTVPAGRSCLIEYAHMIIRLNSTITFAGRIDVEMTYVPVAGAVGSSYILELEDGQGPGSFPVLGLPFGQMIAGDRLAISTQQTSPTPSGTFRTVLHGVEYDE